MDLYHLLVSITFILKYITLSFLVFPDIPVQEGNSTVQFVEPIEVHQTKQNTNTHSSNGDTPQPSTSANNEGCDSSSNSVSGQNQPVASSSNQSSNVNTGFIQNRQGRFFLVLKFFVLCNIHSRPFKKFIIGT